MKNFKQIFQWLQEPLLLSALESITLLSITAFLQVLEEPLFKNTDCKLWEGVTGKQTKGEQNLKKTNIALELMF